MGAEAQEFLREADAWQSVGTDPLPADAAEDDLLMRIVQLYQAADAWSVEAAQVYRRVLATIAIASTVLTMAFLLYDEVEAWGLIVVVGALVLLELAATRFASRSRCHERYIELRVLAECLRVEAFLRYAGSDVCVSTLLPWSLRVDLEWVVDVLTMLDEAGAAHTPSEGRSDVRSCWVEGQRSYHADATGRAAERAAASERVVHEAMALSAALYVATLALELAFGGWAMPPVMHLASLGLWRSALKIALGTASAATIFVDNYYDKLALQRVLDDHRKMERLFSAAAERMDREGATPELLRALAREELEENATWYAYQKENIPELAL